MVQCYSGGFANYILKKEIQKGINPQPRAGFFATVQDRVAAGCTLILGEKLQEYSTKFWEAISMNLELVKNPET